MIIGDKLLLISIQYWYFDYQNKNYQEMNFCGFCDGKTDLGELVFVDALENRSSLDIRNRNNE